MVYPQEDRVPQGRGTRAYMDVFTACLPEVNHGSILEIYL